MATIDVNVPVDLDLAAAAFATRPLVTPEGEAFYHRLGFKSLLPKKDVVLRDATDLGVGFSEIFEPARVEELSESVETAGSCSFACFAESGRFAGCCVGVGGEYFVLRSRSVPLAPFLRRLFDSDVEIRGYDLKSDLVAAYRYLDDASVSAEEAQASLF